MRSLLHVSPSSTGLTSRQPSAARLESASRTVFARASLAASSAPAAATQRVSTISSSFCMRRLWPTCSGAPEHVCSRRNDTDGRCSWRQPASAAAVVRASRLARSDHARSARCELSTATPGGLAITTPTLSSSLGETGKAAARRRCCCDRPRLVARLRPRRAVDEQVLPSGLCAAALLRASCSSFSPVTPIVNRAWTLSVEIRKQRSKQREEAGERV